MIEEFKVHILREGLVKKGERLLLGVSGGPDSIAMLRLFAAVRKDLRLELTACHFNHCLRPEAREEEEFVKELCRTLKIKCLSAAKSVGDAFDGDSLEQTARDMRYDFFLQCSRDTRIKKIALAHHKDDLAETVVMRIVRGTGLKGLRAILPRTKYRGMTVVRPLLMSRKNELVDWLKTIDQAYCIDESNFSDEFLRNKLRLKLMPFLESVNPAIVDNLCSLASAAGSDYDYIEAQAREAFARARVKESAHTIELNLKQLTDIHTALLNHLLMEAITHIKGNTRRIEARHLRELDELIFKRKAGSVVDLPLIVVRKTDTRLIISRSQGAYAY